MALRDHQATTIYHHYNIQKYYTYGAEIKHILFLIFLVLFLELRGGFLFSLKLAL